MLGFGVLARIIGVGGEPEEGAAAPEQAVGGRRRLVCRSRQASSPISNPPKATLRI